eukprot:6537855-Prymnesium_polylepis.1
MRTEPGSQSFDGSGVGAPAAAEPQGSGDWLMVARRRERLPHERTAPSVDEGGRGAKGGVRGGPKGGGRGGRNGRLWVRGGRRRQHEAEFC